MAVSSHHRPSHGNLAAPCKDTEKSLHSASLQPLHGLLEHSAFVRGAYVGTCQAYLCTRSMGLNHIIPRIASVRDHTADFDGSDLHVKHLGDMVPWGM